MKLQEAEWFQTPDTPERKQHWPRLVEKNSAGIADLVPRVQNMYLRNLQVVWKDINLSHSVWWTIGRVKKAAWSALLQTWKKETWKKETYRVLKVVWEEHAMLQILEKEADTELCLRLLGVEEDSYRIGPYHTQSPAQLWTTYFPKPPIFKARLQDEEEKKKLAKQAGHCQAEAKGI